MPIKFEHSNDQHIPTQYQEGMQKLLNEYPFSGFEIFDQGMWVFGIFNDKVVGAMFLEKTQESKYTVHYLAIRKPTQNRGIGKELMNRWPAIHNCELSLSEKLKVVIGDFK